MMIRPFSVSYTAKIFRIIYITIFTLILKGEIFKMKIKNIILGVTPSEYMECSSFGVTLAHLAYKISPSGRLVRIRSTGKSMQGGIMGIFASGRETIRIEPEVLCRDIISEMTMKSYTGIFADFYGDFSPIYANFLTELDRQTNARGMELYVNRTYASSTEYARVLVQSDVSGGSYSMYLGDMKQSIGDRLCLEIVPICSEFLLPSMSADGIRMTRTELDELMNKIDPMPFFSRELCAKYFTYMDERNKAHFILYDDAYTIKVKAQKAENMDVRPVFMLYSEVREFLGEILLECE